MTLYIKLKGSPVRDVKDIDEWYLKDGFWCLHSEDRELQINARRVDWITDSVYSRYQMSG